MHNFEFDTDKFHRPARKSCEVSQRPPNSETRRSTSTLGPQSNSLATIKFGRGFAQQHWSTSSDPLYCRMAYVDASGIGQSDDLTPRASVLAHRR